MTQGGGAAGPVRISSRQFFYIIFAMALGLQLVAVPPLLVREARQGLWLSMLLAIGADLLVAALLYRLGRRYPGKTLFEYAQMALGPVVGRAVALAYAWLFLHTAALAERNYADMFKLAMPETPLPVLITVFFLVAGYGASRGFEVVGRVAEVVTPVAILSVTVALVLLVPRVDLGYLLPPLPRPGHAVYAALFPAAWMGNCAVMGVLMAFHHAPAAALRVKAAAVVAGVSLFTALLLASVVVLGPELAARQLIPIVTAVRVIEIAQLLERLESLFQIIVFGTAAVSISILLAAAALGVAQVTGARDWRPLVWPLSIVVSILGLGPATRASVARFLAEGYPLYALSVFLGLTALLAAVSHRRRPSAPAEWPVARGRKSPSRRR